nr:hypothetical protein Iba_chr10fCG8950 [Ipomoea batatas]
MTDPNLGARVSTLCDHESPPIDLEAAIPIKESPNANTRTKAKILRRRLLLTLRLAIKLKRTQRPTLNSDNSEVIIMLDIPMIPIDLEVADQIRGNLELTSALILSHLLSTRRARVSTLCDHESPPIDLEAAIPIKESPNANTRTKAKILRRRLLLTLRLAIKLKGTQRPTLKSDNPEVIIMLDLPMIPIDLEVADQIRGNLELTLALRLRLVRHELKDLLERLRINQKLSNDVEVMSACNPRVGDDLVT